jgi:ABC-type amino acid transport substrate-binding protein
VQAVVTYKGSPIDGKTTVADLKSAKLGAQVGTTSLLAISDQIGAESAVYDTNDAAVQALSAKQIDGIVVDLPTAFYHDRRAAGRRRHRRAAAAGRQHAGAVRRGPRQGVRADTLRHRRGRRPACRRVPGHAGDHVALRGRALPS